MNQNDDRALSGTFRRWDHPITQRDGFSRNQTISNPGGHAALPVRTTSLCSGDGVIVFEGAFITTHRTLSIKCAPRGDHRICCWAFKRRCSSHCTVLSVTAVEIGLSAVWPLHSR